MPRDRLRKSMPEVFGQADARGPHADLPDADLLAFIRAQHSRACAPDLGPAALARSRYRMEIVKIVVIGGSGLIGTKLVSRLRQKVHEVVAASPNSGVNTITGEGLADALAGAQVVVDVANSPSFEDRAVLEFFQAAGRNLLAAEVAAGVRHHVALSVVGTDRFPDSGLAGTTEPDQSLRDSLYDRALNAVLRVPERHRPVQHRRPNGSPITGSSAAHRLG